MLDERSACVHTAGRPRGVQASIRRVGPEAETSTRMTDGDRDGTLRVDDPELGFDDLLPRLT